MPPVGRGGARGAPGKGGAAGPNAPGRAGGKGKGAAAAADDDEDVDIDFEQHPAAIILLSHAPPKDIRFSVTKDLFSQYANYDALPDRMIGEVESWSGGRNGGRAGGGLVVSWEADSSSSTEYLAVMLRRRYEFKFEKYANGKTPPRAKGLESKRRFAEATTNGPYKYWKQDDEEDQDVFVEREVKIPYKEGGLDLEQVWTLRPPTFIQEDWRPGTRFRARIDPFLPPARYDTLVKMLFNVALPRTLSRSCVDWFNQRLSGKDHLPANKKTTEGEVLRSWGYYGAACLVPGVPISKLWKRTPAAGTIHPAMNFGKHGMTKNRLATLKGLQGQMFNKDESDLNPKDPWRYSLPPYDHFNKWRQNLIIPSWILTEDEMMSMYLGATGFPREGVGANFKLLPAASYVPRKPDPLGCEGKVLADGDSSCTLHIEAQQGKERHELQEYYDEYGHTVANQLRMVKHYFRTPAKPDQPTRALFGDSWFASVTMAGAIHWEAPCIPSPTPPPPLHHHALADPSLPCAERQMYLSLR